MGIQPTPLTTGDIMQGWEKEDVTHVETTDGFDVFMSLGTTSSARVSQRRAQVLHRHPGCAMGSGGSTVGDNPCQARGGCAAGTRQREFGELDSSSSCPSPHPGVCVGWEAQLSPQ